MASAVLPSRNEQCSWGERKAYARDYPNNAANNSRITSSRFSTNPSPNPFQTTTLNSNLIRPSRDLKNNLLQNNEMSQDIPPPSTSPAFSGLRKTGTEGPLFRRKYQTFNLSSCSREELKDLKKRLMLDLQKVRSLLTRIDSRPVESKSSSVDPQFVLASAVEECRNASEPSARKRSPKGKQRGGNSGYGPRIDKKFKKTPGRKRASGLDSKHPVAESGMKKVADGMMIKCKQILMKLMKVKYASVFGKPVDVQGLKLHDYYQIIKQPMDLGTVKSRLNKKEYQTPLDYAFDVRLTFKNALKYNPKCHPIHTLAETMLAKFEELFVPEYQKYETEYGKIMAGGNVGTKQNRSLAKPMRMPAAEEESDVTGLQPRLMMNLLPVEVEVEVGSVMPTRLQVDNNDPVLSRSRTLPKPKAKKDPNRRPMTIEEKLKLGSDLENLPQVTEQMIQIVRKANPQLVQVGDEIELDIESLDVETLWELHRLVNYHKRTDSKLRRRENLIQNQSFDKFEIASLNEVPKVISILAHICLLK